MIQIRKFYESIGSNDSGGLGSRYEPKKPEKTRWILCAANHYDDGDAHKDSPKNIKSGFVTSGRRHHNCISTFEQIASLLHPDEALPLRDTEIKGFLTNDDFFVNRQEAYKIAFKADQIIGPNKGYHENDIGLTSEDLY